MRLYIMLSSLNGLACNKRRYSFKASMFATALSLVLLLVLAPLAAESQPNEDPTPQTEQHDSGKGTAGSGANDADLFDVKQIEELKAEQFLVMLLTAFIIITSVLVHYEALRLLGGLLKRMRLYPRLRIIVLIFGLLLAHLVEVWIFGFGYIFLDGRGDFGFLQGMQSSLPLDYAYYSVVVYSSLGFGDVIPVGPIRFLTGMEALTGLVFVAWSASFTFLEMVRYWRDVEDDKQD